MILNTLILAMRALTRNLMRSLLTMLGIVIGVAAVIAIVTLGNGATQSVTSQVSSLGEKLLFINPGAGQGNGQAGSVRQFTLKDSEVIGREISGVLGVSPSAGTQ